MKRPQPIAVCLEHFDPKSESRRYLRCVALWGGLRGLTLDTSGAVLWQVDSAASPHATAACQLWVSSDDQLMLFRPAGAAGGRLERAGRSLDLPEEKPVEVLDDDELVVGLQRLRLHVHGAVPAEHVAEPSWLEPAKPAGPGRSRSRAATTAAAIALGAAVSLGGLAGEAEAGSKHPPKKPPIRVRPAPPIVAPPPKPPKKPPKPPKKPKKPKRPKKPSKPGKK